MTQLTATRPRYENYDTLLWEIEAAEKFAKATGCTMVKNPPPADTHEKGVAVDYLATTPMGRKILVEVRTRTIPSTKYGTWHVGLRKAQNVKRYADSRGLPAIILISWTDRLGFIPIEKLLAIGTLTMSGRRDRGDQYDWEQMLNVPLSEIHLL